MELNNLCQSHVVNRQLATFIWMEDDSLKCVNHFLEPYGKASKESLQIFEFYFLNIVDYKMRQRDPMKTAY